ncbi:MAG TPA: hypothetical protein VGP72_14090 [Planctomycetota bacterium]
MKRQSRFGKLEVDLSPPNEAEKQLEAELRAFRQLKALRKSAKERARRPATGIGPDQGTAENHETQAETKAKAQD